MATGTASNSTAKYKAIQAV